MESQPCFVYVLITPLSLYVVLNIDFSCRRVFFRDGKHELTLWIIGVMMIITGGSCHHSEHP